MTNVDAVPWIRYEWFKNKAVVHLRREFRGIFGSCMMECGLDIWIAGIHRILNTKKDCELSIYSFVWIF